jgi:hypothetical protein
VTGYVNNIFVADLNGDGRPDIFLVDQGLEDEDFNVGFDLATNVVLLSQANGRLRDVSESSLRGQVPSFNHVSTLADIDGNGTLDVVLSRLGGKKTVGDGILVLLNDGLGAFKESTAGLPDAIAWHLNTLSIPAGTDRQVAGANGVFDLDGDNRLDLVTGSYQPDRLTGKTTLRFFQQSQNGAFTEMSRQEVPAALAGIAYGGTNNPQGSLGVAGIIGTDLNGDGRIDVVVLWEGAGKSYIELLRNEGGFKFTDVTLDWIGGYDTNFIRNGFQFSAGAYRAVDIDLDGQPDLWVVLPSELDSNQMVSARYLFLNDGSGHLQPIGYRTSNEPATQSQFERNIGCSFQCDYRPLVFDADGDGQPDLVLIDVHSGHSADIPYRESLVKITTFPANRPINVLPPGAKLGPGQTIRSQNARYRLVYQSDGDLVLFDDNASLRVWASNTSAQGAGAANMQLDGNFVLTSPGGTPVAETCTNGRLRAFLMLSNTGDLVVRAPGGQTVWTRAQPMCH